MLLTLYLLASNTKIEKWNDLKNKGPSGFESFALNAASIFTKTVPEGASTQIFLATGADGTLRKGAFYEDMKEKKNLPKFAKDEEKARALWDISEELGGIKFDLATLTAKKDEEKSDEEKSTEV